ncbi:hypothetical protein, partial [Streptococcus pneumoniae]|uniref:hypothetical protein n=1 Tax=Streptococcus pneumoniae TaxID=1313 RepID=UPI0013D957D8
ALLAGYGAHLLLTGRLRTGGIASAGLATLFVAAAILAIVVKAAPVSAWAHLAIGAATLALSWAAPMA